MARYIDADRLINEISGNGGVFVYGAKAVAAIVSRINAQPTADVEEVRHGQWIKTYRGVRKNENTGQPMRVYACDCSCCGWHTGNQGADFKRCPMCGAKMDGGDKL
jgi:rubrerythrin